MDGRMQKQQQWLKEKFVVGDKVLWHDLVCEVSMVSVDLDSIIGDELRLDVNGRTYYDYACNVEKVDE
jgi:hypothetical protein